MYFDCFSGVLRTAWGETTRRRTPLTTDLIEVNGPQKEPLYQTLLGTTRPRRDHVRSNFATMAGTAVERSSKVTPAAGRVRPQRYNPERNSPAWVRSTSRNRRRARLRCTAVPAVRPMAKATRGPSNEGSATMTHHTAPLRTRVPSCRSRANSSRWRRRWIKLTAAYGPSGDEPSELHARRGSTCAPGSRVWPSDASYWVDRYVSQQTPQFWTSPSTGSE